MLAQMMVATKQVTLPIMIKWESASAILMKKPVQSYQSQLIMHPWFY